MENNDLGHPLRDGLSQAEPEVSALRASIPDALLPCPFCGGEAEARTGEATGWVSCTTPNCDAHQMHYTIEAAVEAWNTRKDAPLLEALRPFSEALVLSQ